MKQLILSITLFFIAGIASMSVWGQQISHREAGIILKGEFPQAGQVTWGRDGQYTIASFALGNRNAIAYFDEEGKLLGSLRQIFYDELPLVVSRSFARRFDPAGVIEVSEINNEAGTRYRLLLGSSGEKFEVLAFPDGYVKAMQKIKQ